MICTTEHALLCKRMLDFIFLDDRLFLEYLNGIEVICGLLSAKNYLAKCTCTREAD